MQIMVSLSVLLIIIYLLLIFLLFVFQRNLIYYPSKKIQHPFQEQIFNNDNESIYVVVLNPNQENSILYFGGNAEAVANNATSYLKNFPDHTVYLVNYRGYGGSTGEPEEQALFSDALVVFDKVNTQHSDVTVIGRSLGSGVASYVAAERKVTKLVLVTPYDSIENIAKSKFPFFPVSFILLDKYNSLERVKKIRAKTLIIYAENDRVIPRGSTMNLANAFPDFQLKTVAVKNSNHHNLTNQKIYQDSIKQFIQTAIF